MKTVSSTLQTLLESYMSGQKSTWYIADLYIFWLNWGATFAQGFFNSGKILLYTDHDTDLQVGGNTYSHIPISHGDINEKRGVETTDMDVTINYNPTDKIAGLGITWFQAFQSGTFDNCYMELARVYSPTKWSFSMANISSDYVLRNRFFGRVSVQSDGLKLTSCQLSIKSPTELFSTDIPRNLVEPSCLNTFCDGMCGLTKSNYAYSVTAARGSTKLALIPTTSYADGLFTQGSVLCLTGNNAGVTRTIKTFTSNTATLVEPFAFSVSAGDTFTFYRGCAKTIAACEAYGNVRNIRCFPFLPVPNTLL